jgi:hypothetical protein
LLWWESERRKNSKKAQSQGAFVITPPEFEKLLETGEIE